MKVLTTKRIRITENFSLTVDGERLREMINEELKQQGTDNLIPSDATIYVQVPGGADWSNTALEIDEHPIQIEWTVESGENS